MIKKMMLLAGAALALVAFAVPAMAQAAPKFYVDTGGKEVELGNEENPTTVKITGSLSTTSATGLQSGPCEIHAHGFLWNTATDGAGVIDSFIITTNCKTNVPECEIVKATSNVSEEAPWSVTTTGTDGLSIFGANFANTYGGAGCAAAKVPTGFALEASGTATGTTVGNCITFQKAGDLEGPLVGKVTIDGEVCVTDAAGNPVTAK